MTARPDQNSLQILDDVIHLSPSTHFELQNASASGAKPLTLAELFPGVLIEAEGRWTDKHQFEAEKINCDADQFDREIHGDTVLQTEPSDGSIPASGIFAPVKADGELLLIDTKTKGNWKPASSAQAQQVAAKEPRTMIGEEIKYTGVRGPDGYIAVEHLEVGERPPQNAYKISGDRTILPSRDPQTRIEVLEIRKGKKVEGRLKLFDMNEVQDYVKELGKKLLPPAADLTARPVEFRFFVVEDPSVNAAALPDGTVLVNTGLLGAVDNESQLAFVLSHEIAHVLQAHQWREANDTRGARVGILVAAIAGSAVIGNLSMFLGELGMEAVVNGYSRKVENQADRLGLQNVVDHGYDPRSSTQFFRTMVEKYGRSSSAIWSNHDSNLLRGSFLTIQLQRQYPKGGFEHAIVDTEAFKNMKEIMGPVKIM